ncbi:MAG: D-cysteine desulfhydrase family pyridoxal phosphate-dependent enzyme [Paraglaciecola sp.]
MNSKTFSKVQLGFFPTPVVELNNLSKALGGPQIFMKRDDLSGLALGGNKTRKLEYILADALAKGCDSIVTAGAAQSNHCRQTAAGAAKLGLDCHLVLGGQKPNKFTGNLLLDHLFGAHIHWTGENRKGEDIPRVYGELSAQGKKPYIVPYGGSNELGAISFIHAVQELQGQTRGQAFSHIVFASSSGGTHAGLVLGKQLYGQDYQIVGINIDKDQGGQPGYRHNLLTLIQQTANLMGMDSDVDKQQQLILRDDYIGQGYGVVGDLEREAIALTAKHEGILLDPVYTGRAMGGLIDMIRQQTFSPQDKVLFWHTGGAPALFAYGDELGCT